MKVRNWIFVGVLVALVGIVGGLLLLRGETSDPAFDVSEAEAVIAEEGSVRLIVGLASPAGDSDARVRDQAAIAVLLEGTDSEVLTNYPLEPAVVVLADDDGLERLAKSPLVVSIILDLTGSSADQ